MDQVPKAAEKVKALRDQPGQVTIEWQSAELSPEQFEYLVEFYSSASDARSYGFRFTSQDAV